MAINWSKKKVLIIGGTGFLGRNFAKFFFDQKADVYCSGRSKSPSIPFGKYIALNPVVNNSFDQIKTKFDVLINCAAMDGNGFFKKEYSHDIFETNIKIASNVLAFARRTNIKDVVLFSSADIYSATTKVSHEESQATSINDFSSGYQVSKAILECMASYYLNSCPELNVYVLRPSYTYGSGDHFKGSGKSRLIPLLMNKIKNNEKIEVLGPKTKKINLLYVEDLIDVVQKLLSVSKPGFYNVTSTEVLTLNNIVQAIGKQLGRKPKISYLNVDVKRGKLLKTRNISSIKDNFIQFKDAIAKIA